jgi:hypothetical protein
MDTSPQDQEHLRRRSAIISAFLAEAEIDTRLGIIRLHGRPIYRVRTRRDILASEQANRLRKALSAHPAELTATELATMARISRSRAYELLPTMAHVAAIAGKRHLWELND